MKLRGLRDITAPEHRAHLAWAVRVRWLAIAGFSTLAVLAWAVGLLPDLRPPAAIGAAAAVMNAVNHWCVRRGAGLRRVTAVALMADVGLITVLILQTGGARSPFVMLYLLQVVATALLVDLWIAALAALASAVAITAALWAGLAVSVPAASRDDAAAQAVWGLFLLYCLALLTFLGGYIADALRRREGDLGTTRAVLRGTRTRLREAEAQLVHSEKMRALGQFVAGIAHELNNPLGFVAANLDALRRAAAALESTLDAYAAAPLPADVGLALRGHAERQRVAFWRAELPAVLADCAEGVQRAADIVAALRVFARADRGETWSVVDLRDRLERVLALLRHRLPAGVGLVREQRDLPPVECLAGQLDQVFLNVLANAIDAVGSHGTIVLRTRVEGAQAVVEVTDSGPGIAPEVRDRLFEPFFTTKPEGQGTGLGLAVSYGIVERHGGAIRIASPPGGGATVTIAVPLRRCGIPLDRSVAAPIMRRRGRGDVG
jgi:signal transduction histidine kinase